MKKALIALALVFPTVGAMAYEVPQEMKNRHAIEICDAHAENVAAVAEERRKGVTLETMLYRFSGDDVPPISRLAGIVAIDYVYSQPETSPKAAAGRYRIECLARTAD